VPVDDGPWERILGENVDTRIPEEQADNDPIPEGRAMLLGGWISCAVGALLAAGMVYTALYGGGANITAGALGVGFGVLGYFLGARKLATATVFLCATAILFGLAASQGFVPGIAPSDRTFPNLSSLF
jgi:hypothetical protein